MMQRMFLHHPTINGPTIEPRYPKTGNTRVEKLQADDIKDAIRRIENTPKY
jgi:hypothetical protein